MATHRYPLGLVAIAPVVIGLGVYAFTGQEQLAPTPGPTPGSETPAEAATVTATATQSIPQEWTATAVSLEATAAAFLAQIPTATPPVTEHGAFHRGAWVRVNAGAGDCLNARWTPGTEAEYGGVNACLPDGMEGLLTGAAQEAEGRWWWYMAGAGWVAEEFLIYVRDADVRSAMAPQFASQPGLIAFLRQDGAVWVMRPGGSEQRQLLSPRQEDGYTLWPGDLTWSPDGTQLSFTIRRWFSDGRPPTSDLAIINLNGELVQAFPGTAGRSWSPDGTRIAVVTDAVPGDMGGGWKGTPGYVEIATGAVTQLPPPSMNEAVWLQDLPSFNHDGTLVLMPYGWYASETEYERGLVIVDLAGNEAARIVMGENEYFSTPVWSPTANQIAMERSDGSGNSTYTVYDLASEGFVASAAVPKWSPNRGGGCGGGADMARSAWSRDGQRLLFGFMYGEAGTNGIWTLDIASGATSLLPVAGTYNAAAGPDTLAVFSDGGHVFIGDTAGGYPTLITDGHSPVWSSGQ